MTWKLTAILCIISMLGIILRKFFIVKDGDYLELTTERMQEINQLERAKRDRLYEEHA